MASEILSAILQVIVFTLIPLIVYLIRKKQFKNFWHFIGFKSSNRKANLYALLIAIFLALPMIFLTMYNSDFTEIMTDPKSMTGKFREMGFGLESVVLILVIAIFKTALSEEILFRGFIAKRLIAVAGFRVGNWIHAVLFGFVHALLFLTITKNPFFLTVIFVFPTMAAYFMAYINEKMANGSIVPGWIAHATGNILSYTLIGYGMSI